MYFSATIFTMVGFSTPTLTSLTVAVTNCLFTAVALFLIDRIGRRRILLYSLPFMVLGLLLAAYGFSFVDIRPDGSDAAATDILAVPSGLTSTVTSTMPATATITVTTTAASAAVTAAARTVARGLSEQGAASLILTSIMIYVAAYAIGLGNVPWMQSELFPLSVRALGSGAATATNWAANFVVGLTFLPLMEVLGPPWTFSLYAIVCTGGGALIWRIYPETAGLSLEEATALLDHGWGVRR